MQEYVRFVFLLLISLLVLFSLVQCRSVFTDTVDRDKRSINNVNYSSLCMFRKSRLCNHLRELSMGKSDQAGNDQELWKRGVSHFYSNW
ncbi:unnamed protein product [Adineta steineri]|uniref:Uncharacterized protein n=1 Tax=Adineta steineri TaxID=433720 RepID=A0A819PUG1_9BILA|nr:unnamed protein product [Adineta steineri]